MRRKERKTRDIAAGTEKEKGSAFFENERNTGDSTGLK